MKLSDLLPYAGTDQAEVLQDCEVTSVELCARVSGTHALTYLEKEKFLPLLENPAIAAVICHAEMAETVQRMGKGVLLSDAPKFSFYCLHNFWEEQNPVPDVPTEIGEGTQIDPRAVVAPYHVTIGSDVVIDAGAVIGEFVSIGAHTHIHAGAVIGAGSFNPARYKDKAVVMKDCGYTRIGSHVDVFPNSVVVRGVLPDEVTDIGDYVKIDTLCHIAHGVHIGARSFIASGSVIAGNCRLGQNVWVGVNATISNRIQIGDNARVSLGSVVTKDVPAGQTVSGNFAMEHQTFLRNLKRSLQETEN